MKYTKPALSFADQAQRLIDRGLIVDSKDDLVQCLRQVNYYRLSAYWYPFKTINSFTGSEQFASHTTFKMIWRRYIFDRELRLLIMDAIEHIEVAILRTRMVEQFTLLHGPFGYCEIANFNPRFDKKEHVRLIYEIDDAVGHSKEEFVFRFRSKYTSETHLPMWMASEVMSFGQLYTIFKNLQRSEQQSIARQFNLYPPVLDSWLHTLNFIRNVCAHHSRLWNREIPIRPVLPDERHRPEWHRPVRFENDRVFAILTLISYLLARIDPQNDWQNRLIKLLTDYSDVPKRSMGFPDKWQDSPLWKSVKTN
jgi:abortive infection bacteriophage resistance protein